MRSRPSIASYCASVFALVVFGCSCEEPVRTTRAVEDYSAVEGHPTVEVAQPRIDAEPAGGGNFDIAVARQCDFFRQDAVRKVDILWVIDNSGSMGRFQDTLAREFPKFVDALVSLEPPVDFHIGVTSTDTDNEALVFVDRDGPSFPPDRRGTRGALHGFAFSGGASGRYLACNAAGECNVPRQSVSGEDVLAAFEQMSKVGTGGSRLERGLLASYMSLTLEENLQAEDSGSTDLSKNSPFIRPDAALFVIYVSDEDDSSCAPFVPVTEAGRPVSGQPCLADPGCRCEANPVWGTSDYFVRALETLKGAGRNGLVAAGAVVCTQQEVIGSQSGDPAFLHLGCPDDGTGPAYWGGRYIDVAAATGGTAISIRGSFAEALQSLGFTVAGLRSDFRLSRGPLVGSLEVFSTDADAPSCHNDGECSAAATCRSGKCTRRLTVDARSLGECSGGVESGKPALEYCRCDAGAFRNILRFNVSGQPAARSSLEVCYDVNPSFNQACQ